MKRIIASFMVAVVAVSGALTSTAHAAAGQTDVTGVVTENHVAVAGATVTVLCEGNTEVDTVTDAQGSYLVTFPKADCPFGSTVKVTAEKGSKSGVKSGTVQGITTKLNLAIVNVSIPEYDTLGLLLASGAGIGLIAYTRRQQANSSI